MAQANSEEKLHHIPDKLDTQNGNPNSSSAGFKFNAHAPEFVPRSYCASAQQQQQQMPISAAGCWYPCFQFLDGSVIGSDWLYLTSDHQEQSTFFPNPNVSLPAESPKTSSISDDLHHKVAKQVEYLFSDLSLLANEVMAKHVGKDPEGHVPIQVIASMKKIKSLVNNNHNLVAQAIRSSPKLVLSSDYKKVRRRHPFTDSYKEDLQCRTVVAENLPDDHSYQNLEKIFGQVGSVKAIRLCHPQEATASRSKSEVFISNKLHALVEYDNPEVAERAAEQLNDERNWRRGLRVRLLMRFSPKSVVTTRKSEFEVYSEDDEWTPADSVEDTSTPNGAGLVTNSNGEENVSGLKRLPSRGRGKSNKGRVQAHGGRGLLSPPVLPVTTIQCDLSAKPVSKGPRMPDGTRGFTMGRGKPIVHAASPVSLSLE